MNTSFPARSRYCMCLRPFFSATVLLFALATLPAQADWPNTNYTKYYQPPDLAPSGYNVLAAQPPAGAGSPLILADDFPCRETGPITDIHIWASWLDDAATAPVPPVPITLGIWSDVPATITPAGGPVPSHPGILLWSQTFVQGGAVPGQYKIGKTTWAPSPFWDPDPPPTGVLMGNDNVVWEYNFYPDPAGAFVQQGTAAQPTNYWLSVTAGANPVAFGWRTSPVHYNDDAVFGHLNAAGTPDGDWKEMLDPAVANKSLNLAFAVTTTPQPDSPPQPPYKWVEYPDLQSGLGLDVNASSVNAANGLAILADDFQCTVAGPITNIEFWASFKDNGFPGPTTFILSIWSDLPKGTNGFSRPLQRLWTQVYRPGDYPPPVYFGGGPEHFYDPFTGELSIEDVVWLYNFNLFPTNLFCQQGKGTIYWLSVSALPAANGPQWGWKTSTNQLSDAGVFGRVDTAGNLLVPWKPLSNPMLQTASLPVDFAFRISSGPPSPDCDPALNGAGEAPPDTSPNGLDVWALTPTTVGDDFLCQTPGQISGFRIWGSWLGDQVDTNALFEVSLWSDLPATVGQTPYSRPRELLCRNLFYPPQTPQTGGGAVLRYQYSQYASGLAEQFYNPNIPGPAGLIGNDTQIWQYDFFPFVPSCFVQDGGPFSNGKTYWVTVSYIPQTPGGGSYVFGWKTSTKHWQDAAVFGPSPVWQPLFDPRTTASTQLDLAKKVWKFPVTGINKDMFNTTENTADGIQVVLSGPHLITWHYDSSPPWLNFLVTTNAAGDTVLTWSGGVTVPPGGFTHVGFETPGSVPPPILAWNWLNGPNVIGPVLQVNGHVLGDPIMVLNNDFYPGQVMLANSSVEFYTTPPPLDQMVSNGQRNPDQVMQLASPQGPIGPGGGASVMIRESPTKPAKYALFVFDLMDSMSGRLGARDFVLVPLDAALLPAIQSIAVAGGNVMIGWSSVYGRYYQLQCKSTMDSASSWENMGGPIMAVDGDSSITAPVEGQQSFYRVVLLP